MKWKRCVCCGKTKPVVHFSVCNSCTGTPTTIKRKTSKRESLKKRAYATYKEAVELGLHTPIKWCQLCGREKGEQFVHAHHADYHQPLSVVYLCPSHHASIHVWINNSTEDVYLPSKQEKVLILPEFTEEEINGILGE